jgi:hypothetical protein
MGMAIDDAISILEHRIKRPFIRATSQSLEAMKSGVEALKQKAKVLEMIQDWDRCVDKEGGEEEFQKKYGAGTTELINLIEQVLKGD